VPTLSTPFEAGAGEWLADAAVMFCCVERTAAGWWSSRSHSGTVLKPKTLLSILSQADLQVDEFRRLL
jgi:hypothetical protein